MRNALVAAFFAVSLTATAADKKPAPAKAPAAEAGAQGEIQRGEKLAGLKAITVAELLKAPKDHEGKTVGLEGTVRRACEKKGCWMELAASEKEKGPGVRITFKDYGFFVPLDSAGKSARVEGVVKVAELSDEKAKHYEAEGATVPRGADGKAREVQLVATGVVLR